MNQISYQRAAQLALRGNPYSANVMRAARAARFAGMAYRNSPQMNYAARKIGGAYRRYKKRSKRAKASPRAKDFGNPMGSFDAKKCTMNNEDRTLRISRNLYTINLTSALIAGTDIDERQRAIVNLKGYLINMKFDNTSTVYDMFVNIAVVSPKNFGSVPTSEFFRGYGTNRGLDFDLNLLNSTEMHWTPINTDKHVVLAHERFQIGKASNGYGPDYGQFNRYIKINKQIRYEDIVNGAENGVYLCYWYDYESAKKGDTAIINLMGFQNQVICYYSTPTECC